MGEKPVVSVYEDDFPAAHLSGDFDPTGVVNLAVFEDVDQLLVDSTSKLRYAEDLRSVKAAVEDLTNALHVLWPEVRAVVRGLRDGRIVVVERKE